MKCLIIVTSNEFIRVHVEGLTVRAATEASNGTFSKTIDYMTGTCVMGNRSIAVCGQQIPENVHFMIIMMLLLMRGVTTMMMSNRV